MYHTLLKKICISDFRRATNISASTLSTAEGELCSGNGRCEEANNSSATSVISSFTNDDLAWLRVLV